MHNERLASWLRTLRRRALLIGGGSAVGWGVLVAVLLTVLAAWLDLVLDLPPHLRIAFLLAAASGGWLIVVFEFWMASRAASARGLARKLDEIAVTGGQVSTGVELNLAAVPRATLTAGLAQLAVERANELARSVPATRAVSSHKLPRAWLSCGAAGFALVVAGIFAPDLLHTQWLRFSDPWGDHPPYSRIKFELLPGDAAVAYGDGLDLRAVAHGGAVDRLELVLEPASGAAAQMLPMFREPNNAWRATLASVVEPARYFVRTRGARSGRHTIELLTIPRLEGVRFVVTQPAYTGVARYEGELPAGGIAGVRGTQIEVRVKSNRPLSSGELLLHTERGETRVALAPVADNEQEVGGAFELTASGKFTCAVTDVEGQAGKETFQGAMTLLPDERPFVRIVQPREISLATPDAALPVLVSAEDDFGVGRVQLYRSLNDSRPLPIDLPVRTPAVKRADGRQELPLADYQLSPGDVIKLFARVEDNDPDGTKGGESPIVQIQIISQADLQRMLRTKEGIDALMAKYEQARRRMEAADKALKELEEKLAKEPADSEMTQAHKDELERIREQMRRDAREMQKAAEHDTGYDIDKKLSEELKKLAQQMKKAAESKVGSQCKAAKDDLAELREKLGMQKEEYAKKAMKPLEDLRAAFPLKQAEGLFVQLYQRQRDLEQRMTALRDSKSKDDPAAKARMRDLEAEQAQLREALGTLLDKIEEGAAKLPDEERFEDLRQTAEEFAQAVREAAPGQFMQKAETALTKFEGKLAHENAKEAADVLEQFIGKCKGMGNKACDGNRLKFGPSLSQSLSNTMEQLMSSMGLGEGEGDGSGFSMAQSTMQNVGLYGNLPAAAQQERSGESDEASMVATGGDVGGRPEAFAGQFVDLREQLEAAGAGAGGIPARYRQRIMDYYRRIADELGE